MPLHTRLTELFGIEHPILSAPMGFVAGGKLAAAVSNAGGLGLIGGGYGDAEWLQQQFTAAGNAKVGCGFITWSLANKPELLDPVLERQPVAVMLSFGRPAPFAAKIKNSGAKLICQVQSLANAREAIDASADIIVAQGGEAGGHGGSRATFTLVPEVADLISQTNSTAVLVAAGGVADGRALAAALMLGAEGVLIGSRFVMSAEAATPDGFRDAVIAADGDATVKTSSFDVVRKYDWPEKHQARGLKNQFTARWHGNESALQESATIATENERYWNAFYAGDAEHAGVLIGENAGLIRDVSPARTIVERIAAEAQTIMEQRRALIR